MNTAVLAAPPEDELGHLHPEVQAMARCEDRETRIEQIKKPRWIAYDRAKQALQRMRDLLVQPQVQRMPCLLIAAETNNGKSELLTRFAGQHPARDNPGGEGISVPVLLIESPPGPDESRLYNYILDATFAPYRLSDPTAKKESQALAILKRVGLRVLMLDNIHNMLAGSPVKQRYMLNVLRGLSARLKISIVLAGTGDAFNALHTDPQMANRFKPFLLPRWHMGAWKTEEERAEDSYLKLLAAFEGTLPLRRPSFLAEEDEMPRRLLALSEGTIGALSELLNLAAIKAIETGSECIDAKTLAAVEWMLPSEQRLVAGQLAAAGQPAASGKGKV